MYRKASKKHGGACVGLAIGIRAAYVASNIIGTQAPEYWVQYGTKKCVAEAFHAFFSNVRMTAYEKLDQIIVQNSESKVLFELLPKRPFRTPLEPLKCADSEIFKQIEIL
jgi:hypothetical protein